MSYTFSLFRFLIPQEQAVGISLDGDLLRYAVLQTSASSIAIKELGTESAPATLKNATYSSCIPAKKTIARTMEIGLTKQKDIAATFTFEAETHLPYPVDQCIASYVILGQKSDSTNLQLFSALKSDLQEHLDTLQAKSINPEVICPKPLALCHFVKRFYKDENLHIAIDVDNEETTCVLSLNGTPLIARSHPVGLKALSAITTVNEEGEVGINEAELTTLHVYLREISRILLAFQNGYETLELPILFTGPIVHNHILLQLFSSALERQINPEPEIAANSRYTSEEILSFAIPIGCALAIDFEQKGKSVNFRKDEFEYNDKWRRWKKELVLYFCLMTLLSASFYAYGKVQLGKQHTALLEEYTTLLSIMEKPVLPDTIIAMTPDDLDDTLYELEKELKETKEEIALHPDVARVSDLLAWLSTHPNIVINGDDPKAITLESLTYNMVKRPEKGKLKEHYQVRVELEFTARSPTMARELHDALLAPNAFIDPKNELKWTVQRGRFKASFFLKDKTKYPQTITSGS